MSILIKGATLPDGTTGDVLVEGQHVGDVEQIGRAHV